jgi:hypothetical protein
MYLERSSRVMGVRQPGRTEKEFVYMKLMNRSGQAFQRIALGATTIAVAIAASLAVVASPAQAEEAENGRHCVATLPETNTRCFDTYDEAKAFIASVAETTPGKKPSAAAQRAYGDAIQASPQVFWPVWIFTGFDLENYNLTNIFAWTYSIIAFNGPCTTPTTNIDYEKATLPAYVVNDLSSYIDLSNCWTRLYEDPNFGGSFRGYTGDSSALGGFNNITSSIRWS